jgi:hypothetical protein
MNISKSLLLCLASLPFAVSVNAVPVISLNYLDYVPNRIVHARVGDFLDLADVYEENGRRLQRFLYLCDVWEFEYDSSIIQRYNGCEVKEGSNYNFYPRVLFKAIRPGQTTLSFGSNYTGKKHTFTIIVE